MASVKNLKKDLNNIIGEIIQSINLWELDKSDKDLAKSEKLVDQCFDAFDEIIKKIHQKDNLSNLSYINDATYLIILNMSDSSINYNFI